MNQENIAVIGLGYVGLPLAALAAKRGFLVTGYEVKQSVVASLKQGKSHIRDETVERLLAEAHQTGNFNPTIDVSKLKKCSIYLICVPTPVDENNEPDIQPLISAIETITPHMGKGDLVVVESTVFPGTCEQVVIPLVEQLTHFTAGEDFDIAHCPERVNPGDLFWTTENIPRVVGATTSQATDRAANFYARILNGQIFEVQNIKNTLRPKFSVVDGELKIAQAPLGSITKMRSIRDAEAVKAMENTVRDVNIAFVNELAKISDALKLDVVDIIDGMATKSFGKGPFYPGVGVGGHCIAVDPEWLKAASKKAGYMPEMIELSRMTNNGMPAYTVSLLQDLLNERALPLKNTRVAVLGVSYKKNVDDPRESPFYEVSELLSKKGAQTAVYDSWYPAENCADSLEQALYSAKALLLVTEHDDMVEKINNLDLKSIGIEVVVDGRNALNGEAIVQQGVLYHGIGRKVE